MSKTPRLTKLKSRIDANVSKRLPPKNTSAYFTSVCNASNNIKMKRKYRRNRNNIETFTNVLQRSCEEAAGLEPSAKILKSASSLPTNAMKKLSCFVREGEGSKDVGSMVKGDDSTSHKSFDLVVSPDSFVSSATEEKNNAFKKIKSKYTPLEEQFMEIKDKHPDAILFVECGYKFRFFGDDAQIASRELNITCSLDHNFLSASIPAHRLFVHVNHLVSKGYKVGVVRQTEMATLKAAGDNPNSLFNRELTDLYTKATLIEEDFDIDIEKTYNLDSLTRYLVCIAEITGKSGRVQDIGLVGIQPNTGDILYDSFSDDSRRSELETRLFHLEPGEIILPQTLSDVTKKLIQQISSVGFTPEDRIRTECLTDDVFKFEKAFNHVTNFYQRQTSDGQDCKLETVISLPPSVICCLSALIVYLQMFNLDKILHISSPVPFMSVKSKHVHLPSTTLKNLEVFHNLTDGSEKGSLYWIFNHTSSKFGARMLKRWISQPLRDIRQIEERQNAVKELATSNSSAFPIVLNLFKKLPDIEKALIAIYLKKCSPSVFSTVCAVLNEVYFQLTNIKTKIESSFQSHLLRSLLLNIALNLEGIQTYKATLNEDAARTGNKTELFSNWNSFPKITQIKKDIQQTLHYLGDYKKEIAKVLQLSDFEYVTIGNKEFLIEVRNSSEKQLPMDWIKVSSTKTVSRYLTPVIADHYRHLCQLREQLQILCQEAWLSYLGDFSKHYGKFKLAVSDLAKLDCLMAFSAVAKQNGYCRPEFIDNSTEIHIEDGRHPIIDQLLEGQVPIVPNSTYMESSHMRCMVITGPNMGGKSSYIRQVALITIMAHIGSYVPAVTAKFGCLDGIYTRMGAYDEIYQGRSTFLTELQETSEIMSKASSSSLVILDELGRGTSTHDGSAIAYAVLHFFLCDVKCLTLFVTHYPILAELEKCYPGHITNLHMAFMLPISDDVKSNSEEYFVVTFLYQLVKGVALSSYGLNVARLAGIPESVLSVAAKHSLNLENKIQRNRHELNLFLEMWSSKDYQATIKKFKAISSP